MPRRWRGGRGCDTRLPLTVCFCFQFMRTLPVHRFDLPEYLADALSTLEITHNDIILYSAGLPTFPSNFTRDSILSAILFEDPIMMRNQLVFCAAMQGKEKNRITGEEPGKIFHEMPPMRIRGLSTEFNACETTALFILGHEVYLKSTGDTEFIARQKKYLENAVEYILSHIINNLFAEDPSMSGAQQFALRVTYWKDSQIHNRDQGIPVYPAVFTLAHVQNMRALKSAAMLLNAPDLAKKAKLMLKHLWILFDEKQKVFQIGIDKRGFLTGISSDTLHILYYLEPDEISPERVAGIAEASKVLETPYGYRTLSPKETYIDNLGTVEEGYHARTIWPFEQAFIHSAARKFNLPHVAAVAERVYEHLDVYPELFVIEKDGVRKGGSKTQLWTLAANYYFSSMKKTPRL